MRLDQLSIGKKQRKKRLGRGISSGTGKTSGRGTKGQKSRAGARIRAGFEGGQTPIYQRLPKKRGIKRFGRIEARAFNVEVLEKAFPAGAVIDRSALLKAGLIKNADRKIKILGDGVVTKVFNVKDLAVSKSAQDKIEKAGGTVENSK